MIVKQTTCNAVKLSESGKAAETGAEIYGVILAAGSANATVVLDNSEDGTGTEKLKLAAVTASSEVYAGSPISFSAGCYATLSGTDAEVTIIYK